MSMRNIIVFLLAFAATGVMAVPAADPLTARQVSTPVPAPANDAAQYVDYGDYGTYGEIHSSIRMRTLSTDCILKAPITNTESRLRMLLSSSATMRAVKNSAHGKGLVDFEV